MGITAILGEVARFPAKHVVLTGGEPMIARGIRELAAALREGGYHITIETAGTVLPEGLACDLASLSPKLAHSAPAPGTVDAAWISRHESARLRPEVLREWVSGYAFQLKFVVGGREDLREIESVLAGIGGVVPPWKVLLMPEGRLAEGIAEKQEFVVEICKDRGYRYCDRLHLRLFGDTRGT